MSFRANFLSDIPCYAAEFPVFARNREFTSNVLICHAISRSGGLKKRQIWHNFANSLLNSLGCTKWEQFGRHVRYAGG